jgi:hypothetical protein
MRILSSILALAALLVSSRQADAECLGDADSRANRFLQRQVTIPPEESSVARVVDALTKQKVPVSFIQGNDEGAALQLRSRSGSARDILNAICLAAPSYEADIVDGRIMLYPKDAKLQTVVQDMDIKNLSRLGAAEQVVEILKARYQILDDLVPPFVFGNPNNTVYTDLVTVAGPMSALKALVALLGKDETLALAIVRAKTGVRVMGFKRVPL